MPPLLWIHRTVLAGVLAVLASASTVAAEDGPWWQDAVVYEVFVRSFFDSNGDAQGDFRGMERNLDYLQDLGVRGMWLMPVFQSPIWHGYTTSDYMALAPDYGTMKDFESLLAEAKRRDIRVLMDLMVNHSSHEHEWFQKSVRKQTPYDDWFLWFKEPPGNAWLIHGKPEPVMNGGFQWHEERGEYFYAYFGDRAPDLNFTNPQVRAKMIEIAKYWLGKGAAGFRLDAAQNIVEEGPGRGLQYDSPGTIAWWTEFSEAVKADFPDAFLIGEVWSEYPALARYHNEGRGLDACFDFPLQRTILSLLNGESSVADFVELARGRSTSGLPRGFLSPFLSNHDQLRAVSALGDHMGKARQAAVLSLTANGTPFVLYGEEVGSTMAEGVRNVKPMPWTDDEPTGGYTTSPEPWSPLGTIADPHNVEDQLVRPDSLRAHYQKLIRLRANHPELWKGERRPHTPRVPSSSMRRSSARTAPSSS